MPLISQLWSCANKDSRECVHTEQANGNSPFPFSPEHCTWGIGKGGVLVMVSLWDVGDSVGDIGVGEDVAMGVFMRMACVCGDYCLH